MRINKDDGLLNCHSTTIATTTTPVSTTRTTTTIPKTTSTSTLRTTAFTPQQPTTRMIFFNIVDWFVLDLFFKFYP